MNIRPLLSFVLLGSTALSQTTVQPLVVADMTPELMDNAINTHVMVSGGPAMRRKLIADAILLKRIDLIQTCFVNGHTVGDVLNAIAELPNNVVKQKSVIMMLRTPSTTCWPKEGPLGFFSGVPATGMIEPMISTIPSLLPGETLKKDMVATQAARQQLADRLLSALMAKGIVVNENEKNILYGQPTFPIDQDNSAVVPPIVDKAMASQTPQNLPAKNRGGSSISWIVRSGLALLSLACLALWLSKRKK